MTRSDKLSRRLPTLALMMFTLAGAMLAVPTPASADHGQPAPDITKMDYSPIGHFKPGDAVPTGNACKTSELFTSLQAGTGRRFNPSGKYNAFDNNVFEVFCLPFRAAGDKSAEDEVGGGTGSDPGRGFCAGRGTSPPQPGPEAPLSTTAGRCPNHQLEYIDYYEETMRDILGDFGVEMKRYEFENPGGGNTFGGRAINPAAVVPGADHPDETIVIGAHFDQTTEGPSSAWDSAEGHAQVIRVAKLMADYWRATNTRPSATVKFIPWDGEETGTLGSLDYAQNNIVPGEEHEVRGYWNTDPCAGGYPAYRYGNPNDRIDLGIQLASPDAVPEVDPTRIEAFNERAPLLVEQVFEHLDDTITLDAGKRDIFVATSEATATSPADIGRDVFIAKNRPVLFASDWRNFEALGIPFFNPGPEVTGPDDELNPNNPDGIAILHTPNDNMLTLNRMTGPGPTNLSGERFSEGWIKGMEMCAHMLAWGMLQPTQGGGQLTNGDVVAYYEALPNEAIQNQVVTFDAGGSYQYAAPPSRAFVPDRKLEYSWDFGDGTKGTGRRAEHRYPAAGVYDSKLTVTNTETGQKDTQAVPITVIASNLAGPILEPLEPEDEDGAFQLEYGFEPTRDGFEKFIVEQAGDFRALVRDQAEGDIAALWTAAVAKDSSPDLKPWQRSDSGTRKLRGNQFAEGKTSYWTGVSPEQFAPAGKIQQGKSQLTLNAPIDVPAQGSPTLSYFSLFQNEGDDRGLVEVAVEDGDPATEPEWQKVDEIFAVSTAAGGPFDPAICNPSEPQTFTEPLRERAADLSSFKGEKVLVRFSMILGAENRVLSQPCGWYIDDIRVETGEFAAIGETDPKTTTFDVKGLTAGTYTFRVKGSYADGVLTAPSNTKTVRVTRGATPGPAGPGPGTGPGGPGTGPGGPGTGPGTTPGSCVVPNGFARVGVKPRRRGAFLKFKRSPGVKNKVAIRIIQQARRRKVVAGRVVARFNGRTRTVRWNGEANRRGQKVTNGYYVARFRVKTADGTDTRQVAMRRSKGRFKVIKKPFQRRESCGLLRAFKLGRPVFSGTSRGSLRISYLLSEPAVVTVEVRRGGRTVRSFGPDPTTGGSFERLKLSGGELRKGTYKVRLRARSATSTVTATLKSRRL